VSVRARMCVCVCECVCVRVRVYVCDTARTHRPQHHGPPGQPLFQVGLPLPPPGLCALVMLTCVVCGGYWCACACVLMCVRGWGPARKGAVGDVMIRAWRPCTSRGQACASTCTQAGGAAPAEDCTHAHTRNPLPP